MPSGRLQPRLLIATLILLAISGLAGCGQKGPLYLPDEARALPESPTGTA